MSYLQQLGDWERALKLFQKKHGRLASGVGATLHEEVRRNGIKAMRGLILEPEHRFFLALLMNAPTRADLLALVAQRFSKPAPIEIVMRWAQELMETSDAGVSILDAVCPESLDDDVYVQSELFFAALQYFAKREKKVPLALRGLSDAELKRLQNIFADSAFSVLMI
jgi:hypothetical protein